MPVTVNGFNGKMIDVPDPFHQVDLLRVGPGARAAAVDLAATEEPMEIRLGGEPFAVIMRTPGADADLTAGFLLSERVILDAADLAAMESCRDPLTAELLNIVTVRLAAAAMNRLPKLLEERRQVTTNSACGLCGRRTIASLRAEAPRITASWQVRPEVVSRLPIRLRGAQAVFAETGGLHAAGLFTTDGDLESLAEDVGRHNAVDKVIGRAIDRLPLARSMLFVSGRTSFEIVQKAFLAGVPLVASVSAPSSLAIDLAEEAGITLLGFVRGDRFNCYTHPERVIE